MINLSAYKNKAISFCWIACLLILIALLWILTQPLMAYYLLRTVNRTFIKTGQPYRIASSLAQNRENSSLWGYWYSLANTQDSIIVFAFMRDGILVPLGGIVSPEGDVKEMIPLSAHAAQVMDELPINIQQMYVARIEKDAKNNKGGRAR
jgi:hypothetical protein